MDRERFEMFRMNGVKENKFNNVFRVSFNESNTEQQALTIEQKSKTQFNRDSEHSYVYTKIIKTRFDHVQVPEYWQDSEQDITLFFTTCCTTGATTLNRVVVVGVMSITAVVSCRYLTLICCSMMEGGQHSR